MKLVEALELIQASHPATAERERYLLGCSSTTAQLQTFFRANLIKRRPDVNIEVTTLPYGNLLVGLEDFNPTGYSGVAVVCEWYDFDPRLGFRRLGGWAPSAFDDIVKAVQAGLARLRIVLEKLSASVPVAVALPALPLPPLEISIPAQALVMETRLWVEASTFAEWCVSRPNLRLLSPAELDRLSPAADRFDLRAEISHGTPYRLSHVSALAELMSMLLIPSPPLKGLITDLDDTLWSGILGEVGVSGVNFTLDTGAQSHGLYQQFLQSLAERGVLISIASKNDPALVKQALERTDLRIRPECFFPIEVHWGPKSESVARILKTWNIAADAVAYIDDSPIELAEVQARFPQIRCATFPSNDPGKLLDLFASLRYWFGKSAIREEDRLRSQSLQRAATVEVPATDAASREAFLSALESKVSFNLSRDVQEERAFELLNKTNQFNLNGRRISEARWREVLTAPDSFLLTVHYADKFGPLGKIAVVLGERNGLTARLLSWAMSCRAFSRRIEYATLQYLFNKLDVNLISFDFQATDRNGPLRECFASLGISEAAPAISRSDFESRSPRVLYSIDV